MHTPEQSRELWCPMSRVAQAGNVDIPVAYNRSLTKQTQAATVTQPRPADDFNLGEDATETKSIVILTATQATSMAANCLGDKCAMWRWAPAEETRTKMRTAPNPTKPGETIEYPVQEYLKSDYGFCGLAGRPEIF